MGASLFGSLPGDILVFISSIRTGDVIGSADDGSESIAPAGRFVYFVTGGAWVRAGRYAYCAFKGAGVWLPAAVLPTSYPMCDPSVVELAVSSDETDALPNGITVVNCSGMLRTVFDAYATGQADVSSKDALGILLLPELRAAASAPYSLTVGMPSKSSRIAALCDAILRHPSKAGRLPRAAAHAGISVRTLSRLFNVELDTTAANWRRDVQIATALCALENGVSIADIAGSLGFRASAFSTFFRARLGYSPRDRQVATERRPPR